MTVNDEYWDVNGVPLSTLNWDVRTLGGSRYDLPELRGSDQQHAYVAGKEFRPKMPDSRVITLAMWMTGANWDDAPGTPVDQRRSWNDNWRFLRSLFWNPQGQFDLTRRWWLSDLYTGEGAIQVATAKGQVSRALQPSMTGRTRVEFTVDITLADPFFYGDEVEYEIPMNSPTAVVYDGDYLGEKNFTVEFHSTSGVLTNPALTNATPVPYVYLLMTGASGITAGNYVTFDVGAFTALSNTVDVGSVGGSLGRGQYISHSGARKWMGLVKGTNMLFFTASAGTGYATVRFRPAYV